MMVKVEDKREIKWAAGLRYGAMVGLMPYWLLVIFLLLLIPAPSFAALPTVETLSPITSHLKLPSGVAVGDDETIYVAESNLDQLRLFNKSGVYQRSIYGLADPAAVAVDAAGRIYIGNIGRGNVEVYASDLSLIGKLGQGDGEFQKPVGVAVDSVGLIYVVDGREHKVKVYNANRTFKFSFGSMGTGNGQFQTPTSIVINEVTSEILIPDLVALSTSARVQVFDLDGGFLRSFITTGTNESGDTVAFIRPYGIAVDTLDRIYVTDGYQNVVTVYGTSGNYLGKFYDTNRPLRNPLGIAFAPGTSRLFVASLNAGAVETYGIDNVYGNIAATPSSHDFGTVMIDAAPTSQSFALTNDGSGDLSIGAVTLTGADASEFSIISSDCTDRILAPAAGCTIDVKFQPLTAGSKSASLSVISDDLYLPVLHAVLSGNVDELQHRLVVSKIGLGSGAVQAAPAGIDCGSTCAAEYAKDTIVTLSAQPSEESAFIGWSGGGCSGTAACTVTMAQAITVAATFDLVVSTFSDTHTIEASAGANGSISPAGTTTYDAGTTVNFTIAADAGYKISDVLVDGDSVGAVTSYSFENLAASHTIAAEFVTTKTLLLSSIEMGEVSVNDQWKRVEFNKRFTDPVVVAKPASLNDPSPAVVRVRSVDAQGFEVRIQEWNYLEVLLGDTTAHAEEQVGYIVIERGSYILEGGTRIEAGRFSTDTTSSFGTTSFAEPFTVPPVVMSSVVTYNDEEMAVIGRIGNINATGFGYMLQEQGLGTPTHEMEGVSFIAWEPSQGSQNGVSFEVGAVNAVRTQSPKEIAFSGSYLSQPLFIADLQTANGGTVNLRWSDKSAAGVSILLDQEQSSSTMTSIITGNPLVPPTPSTENVGYLTLWSAEMQSHVLTVEKAGLGSGQVEAQNISCGTNCSANYSHETLVTLSATADSGSFFAGWSGGECSGTDDCTVTMDQVVTVTATFDLGTASSATYTITATAGSNGSITPQGETIVNKGAAQLYTIKADAGYRIDTVTVDGEAQTPDKEHKFSNIGSNHFISATFAPDTFKLTDITMGEVSVGHIWERVVLDRFYVDPIVVAKPASRNEDDPAVVRIRNVSTQGFDIKIQEWGYLDGVHAEELVSYIVIESGSHVLNGRTLIEAGRFETSNTDTFDTVRFTPPKRVPPIVISSVVSYNEEDAVVGRIKGTDTEGFQYMLQEQADNTTGHATETVAYIAWEPSVGWQDGVSFEVSCVGEAETQQFAEIGFLGGYTEPPLFVADLQTADSSDAANLRWKDKEKGNIDVLIDQEKSPRITGFSSSLVEEIGYLVLSEQAAPLCVSENDCDGDGLTDDDERNIYGTNPYLANTDGDGLDDGHEVRYWLGRWNEDNDSDGLINLLDYDSDGEGGGEYDGSSYAGSSKPRGCSSALAVVSNNVLPNGEEDNDGADRALRARGTFDKAQPTLEKQRGFTAPNRTFKQRPGFRSPVRGFDRRINFD